jgi:hypothetical protein
MLDSFDSHTPHCRFLSETEKRPLRLLKWKLCMLEKELLRRMKGVMEKCPKWPRQHDCLLLPNPHHPGLAAASVGLGSSHSFWLGSITERFSRQLFAADRYRLAS